MNRVLKLSSPSDDVKIQEMNSLGYLCIQIFTDGTDWYGLFIFKQN